ncbi:MAG TPA: RidA family protein [Actinomycetota bacterium]|nr:RidA family protein [Actinomycetota bacterium]
MSRVDDRLAELGLELPPPTKPIASYVPVVVSNGLAFVSGQTPSSDGVPMFTGKVGADVSVEQAQQAAAQCALQALSVLRDELGDLDRIQRIVALTVYVATASGFNEPHRAANGASDLLLEVFGDAGRHARAAIGVFELPLGVPVEVSVTAEVA